MRNQTKAFVFAALAICFWSTVATAFKLTLQSVSVPELLFYSSSASTLALWIVVFIGRTQNRVPFDKRFLTRSVILGGINPFLYYLVLFHSYSLLPAQEAQALNYTWPIVLVLMSVVFLKQRADRTTFLAMSISFFGVIVIGTRGDVFTLRVSSPLGDTLALGSAFLWSVYWIGNLRSDTNPLMQMAMNFFFGTLFIAAYYFLFCDFRILAMKDYLGCAYVGFFEMGMTFLLWHAALRNTRNTAVISNLVYVSPFLSLLLINIVLDEEIQVSTVIGLQLIVSGIVLHQVLDRRKTLRS